MGNIDMGEVPNYPEDRLTPQEEEELLNYMAGGSYPKMQEQNSIVGFFNKILERKDTTKAGNLKEGEIMAVRTLKSTYNYANTMGLPDVALFINTISEDMLATSLSRDAALLNAAITSKKQLSTESRQFLGDKKKKWLQKD